MSERSLIKSNREARVTLEWVAVSLAALILAGAATAQDEKKPMPAKDAGEVRKFAAPPVKHRAVYAQEYYHSFKGDEAIGPEFHWHGLEPQSVVTFEPAGLRITLPSGSPGKRMGTGVGIKTIVKGDFEITMSYEMIKEPDPDDAGQGTGLFFWVDLNKPNMNRGFISRVARPGKQFVAWFHLSAQGAEKPIDVLRPFPANEASGRLRLVRTGAELYHYVAEGPAEEFALLLKHPFGAEDLQSIRWGGQTGGARAALEGRFIDIRIRADSLPELPAAAPAAVPGQAVGEPVGKDSRAGSLAAALGLGLAVLVFAALGLGLMFHLRRRQTDPDPEEAGILAAPTTIALTCPDCGKRLKARSALMGKKVKCPQCGQPVQVPATKQFEV